MVPLVLRVALAVPHLPVDTIMIEAVNAAEDEVVVEEGPGRPDTGTTKCTTR